MHGQRGRLSGPGRSRDPRNALHGAVLSTVLLLAAGAAGAQEDEPASRFSWWGATETFGGGLSRGRVEFNISPESPESAESMRIRLVCDDGRPLLTMQIFEPLIASYTADQRVTFNVDGERFERYAAPDYWRPIGYLPLLNLLPDDPLIGALMRGETLQLTLHGAAEDAAADDGEAIPLAGTFDAFTEHLSPCLEASEQ